jgi:hypothetical protein
LIFASLPLRPPCAELANLQLTLGIPATSPFTQLRLNKSDAKRMNVNDVKKQLQTLGISTSTPGLQGDERFEELSYRLEQALKGENKGQESVGQTQQSEEFVVPSLSQLSIGEIRSRLTALGESTNTPGLSGEERRNALMRRLINAVCATGDDHEISSKPVPEVVLSPVRLAVFMVYLI